MMWSKGVVMQLPNQIPERHRSYIKDPGYSLPDQAGDGSLGSLSSVPILDSLYHPHLLLPHYLSISQSLEGMSDVACLQGRFCLRTGCEHGS